MNFDDDYDDYEYDGYDESGEYTMPEAVRSFLLYFRRALVEGNMYEINALYENTFSSLSKKYFRNREWPPVEAVVELVGSDEVFLMFYSEIYYRHIYANLTPTLEQRFASYEAYCKLFDHLLGVGSPEELPLGVHEIPPAWIWDMVDEFIYQYQSFCQFRHKTRNLSAEDVAALSDHPEMWSVTNVLAKLYGFVAKSNVEEVLKVERANPDLVISGDEPGMTFGSTNLYKMLGYFSMVGLLRLHTLLGDYRLALQSIAAIDITDKRAYYTLVTACHISLFYYLGFGYMMMRRYVDAIGSWSTALNYITRTKQFHTRSYQYDSILKMNEQMYTFLAATISLSPRRIDESLQQTLRDKHADRMTRMQNGDVKAFEEAFSRACPKFINPAVPDFGDLDAEAGKYGSAFQAQLSLFLRDVRAQFSVPRVRSYLKLYTSMATDKLAGFLSIDEAEFRTLLMCYKHKTCNLIHEEESMAPLDGTIASSSDVTFYLERDMVTIADTKVARRYCDYFIRHVKRFSDIMRKK
ncbi:eukaryotic translation initiation factor 3 subunit L [Thecamonas trahens ATCC 50062]|uniref:Eukaryotic translation initiation factor 3 subunit L n=1 Tax=Thecamonas trahens ATCC 50062 TaxID=461836 RepID=A0A0L0DGF3_THETB|nr:eukaryotic translation initiation factor 3 subunit L [Thecamonas trahens ATCC 50062]KNC51412.1 eukaryotic translation initiation factor 3 subunit L [Thecamonas trahens ATCC 50062]|eukprot:XP_013756079.1 eukaryotic translation initiation factor 3 subunit L [Thecamonas trahens ATCC 50062]